MPRKKTHAMHVNLTPGEVSVLTYIMKNIGARQMKPAIVDALFHRCRLLGGNPVEISELADKESETF